MLDWPIRAFVCSGIGVTIPKTGSAKSNVPRTALVVTRYTLWAEIGIAVLATALAYVRACGNTALGAALFTALTLLIAGQIAQALYKAPVLSASEGVLRELNSLPNDSEPIVVADHHVFMELAYYAPPRIRGRLVYAVKGTRSAISMSTRPR